MTHPHVPSDWKPRSVERFKATFGALPIIRLLLGGLLVLAALVLAGMFVPTLSMARGPEWSILGVGGVAFAIGAFFLQDARRELRTPDYLVEIDPSAGAMLLVQPKGIERKNPKQESSQPARWSAYVRDSARSMIVRAESITRLTVETSDTTRRRATRGGGSYEEPVRTVSLIAWPEKVVVLSGEVGAAFDRKVAGIASALGKEVPRVGGG
ncbi:MAG: hypothetical protein JJ863_18445 [Deltaproteobacteria bacterium]|nr:hypothetical protein [Deltaproteobacteria bacterium]